MEFINGSTFGAISATLNILFLLLIASYFLNLWIDQAGIDAEGADWKLVVIGVFYTQVGIGMLDKVWDWNAFFIGMLAYFVSGFPMIYGARMRNKEMQNRARQAIHE
jgi:hypothetical protein